MAQDLGRAAVVALFSLISVAVVTPSTAFATFPGANGKIAFSTTSDDSNPTGCPLSSCNWEIYAINPDGTGMTRLTFNALQDVDPSWSHDAQKIAFTRRTGPAAVDSEVWVMNANGSGQASLGVGREPSWSPDRQRMTLVNHNTDCFCDEIVVMNADGTGRTSIFADNEDFYPGSVTDVDWSPDGEWIAFAWDQSGGQPILKVRPDGSDLTLVVYGKLQGAPTWSPRSDEFAFRQHDPLLETFGVYATSQGLLLEGTWASPAWSPDGTKLAVVSEGSPFLYTASIGGPATRLTSGLAREWTPDWQSLQAYKNYPRPGGGAPLQVPLVTAYTRCFSPNSQHVAPLAEGSCTPPVQQSSRLTTSTFGRQQGFARFDVRVGDPGTPADEADTYINASLSDVRRSSDQADYAGDVLFRTTMRITDRGSGYQQTVAATVQDLRFDVPITCSPTVATPQGSNCVVSTSADTLLPGAIVERRRSVISMPSVSVTDAGPDGVVTGPSCPPTCGTGDEATYVTSGVFAP